jgi:hypothetical protein
MGGACSTYGKGRGAYRISVGRPEGKSYLENLYVDGRIIVQWIFKNWVGTWTGLTWLGIGTCGWLL